MTVSTPSRTRKTAAERAASKIAAEQAAAEQAAKDAAEQAAKDAEDAEPKTTEKTYAETLTSILSEDPVRIIGSDGKTIGKTADAVAEIEAMVTAAEPKAVQAAIAWENAERTGDTLSDAVLEIRSRFLLGDGMPDWSSTMAATKAAISPLVSAAMIPSDAGDRIKTMWRVTRAAARRRDLYVSLYVNAADSIGFSAAEVLAVVKTGEKAAEATDAKTKKLVARTNRQFRVGTDRPDNAARSPFEPKKERNTPTGTVSETETEKKAREALETVQGFRNAAKVVDSGIVSSEVLEIVRDLYSVLTSSKPRLGTTHKKSDTADTLLKAARILYVAAANLAGESESLTDAETQDCVAALQRSN